MDKGRKEAKRQIVDREAEMGTTIQIQMNRAEDENRNRRTGKEDATEQNTFDQRRFCHGA